MSEPETVLAALEHHRAQVRQARERLDAELLEYLRLVDGIISLRKSLHAFHASVEDEFAKSAWTPPDGHPLQAEHERREMLRRSVISNGRFADAVISRLPNVSVHLGGFGALRGDPDSPQDLPRMLAFMASEVRSAADQVQTSMLNGKLIPQCIVTMNATLWGQRQQFEQIMREHDNDVAFAPGNWIGARAAVWEEWTRTLHDADLELEIPGTNTPLDSVRQEVVRVDGDGYAELILEVVAPGLRRGEVLLAPARVVVGSVPDHGNVGTTDPASEEALDHHQDRTGGTGTDAGNPEFAASGGDELEPRSDAPPEGSEPDTFLADQPPNGALGITPAKADGCSPEVPAFNPPVAPSAYEDAAAISGAGSATSSSQLETEPATLIEPDLPALSGPATWTKPPHSVGDLSPELGNDASVADERDPDGSGDVPIAGDDRHRD